MNVNELPKLFPGVLSGEVPLGVFGDACQDCGFVETGFLIQRLCVRELVGGSGSQLRSWTVAVAVVDWQDRPTGTFQHAVRNDSNFMPGYFNSEGEAWIQANALAIHWAEWAIKHGEAPRKAPASNGTSEHSSFLTCDANWRAADLSFNDD